MVKPVDSWCMKHKEPTLVCIRFHRVGCISEPTYTATTIRKAWEEFADRLEQPRIHNASCPHWRTRECECNPSFEDIKEVANDARRRAKEW